MLRVDQVSPSHHEPLLVTPVDQPAELTGQMVLYVGGRTRKVARFRSIIKAMNGFLVHHDGGLHDGFSRLKKLVAKADIILYPVDCLGHNASAYIKHTCKQTGKPLILLRTSSLSAFNEGVAGLVTHFNKL